MKNLYILFLITLSIHLLGNENKDINDPNVTIKILELKISDLETQYKEIQDEQQEHFKNQYDVIEKVEGFYERSWNKLIFFFLIGGLGAIVGILIPLLISWFQGKEFKKNSKKLQEHEQKLKDYDARLVEHKEEIEQYLENKKSEIEKKLREIFTQQYERIKEEISLEISHTEANIRNEIIPHIVLTYLTLYKTSCDNKEYEYAFNNIIEALRINLYLEKPNLKNIGFIINKIVKMIGEVKDSQFNLDKEIIKTENIIKILESVIDRYPDEYGEQIQKIIDFVKSI